jgi:hypothetical protein
MHYHSPRSTSIGSAPPFDPLLPSVSSDDACNAPMQITFPSAPPRVSVPGTARPVQQPITRPLGTSKNIDSANDHNLRRVSLVPIRGPGETVGMFRESSDLKKAFNVRVNNGESYPLRREMVYCFFDIPATEAARIMRVSLSLLKKIRTWVNVDRWPCSQLHSGEFVGLTRAQVIQGRDEVILGLEQELKETQSSAIELALKILKEVKGYAITYSRLVVPSIPDTWKKPTVKCDPMKKIIDPVVDRGSGVNLNASVTRISKESGAKKLKVQATDSEKRLRDIMDSMQPRQVAERKAKVSVVTTVEPEDEGCFWPICITQEFNFNLLFERDGLDNVEDELKLGPLKISSTVGFGPAGGD